MRKYLIIVLYVIILSNTIVSCKVNHISYNVVLKKEYDIVTDANNVSHSNSFVLRSYIKDGHIIEEMIRHPSEQFIVYDKSDAKILDSIDLSIHYPLEVMDAIIIGEDSIMIALNTIYDNDFHDSAILIIDRNKNIIDTVDISDFPVKTHDRPMLNDSNRLYVSFWDFPLNYTSQAIFIPFNQWYYYSPHVSSLVGLVKYSNNGTSNAISLPITYTDSQKGYYWTPYYRTPSGITTKNAAYVFFPNSPVLYKYLLKGQKIIKKTLKFSTIDKIKPYQVGEEGKPFDAFRSKYESLVYDSLNQRLYLTARKNCDTTDGPLAAQEENSIYSFIIMDENMKKLGEGIIPEGYQSNILPYKNGFLLLKKDQDQEKHTFSYFSYTIEKGDVSFLEDQIRERRQKFNSICPKMTKKESLIAYFQKIVGQDYSKYSTFVMFSESACPHCSTKYTQVLRQNKQNILENDVAVIIINEDTSVITDFCNEADGLQLAPGGMPPLNKIPIYCDSNNAFHNFFDYWINIRIIRFDDKGSLILDEIINPSDMDKFNRILQEKAEF